MAPTLLKRIVDLPPEVRKRYDVGSMRSIVVAAAPCPMRVKEEVLAYFGPVLYEFYGSTELGINTILGPEDMLRKPGSCGRAAPGVELAILDDGGRPLPAGQPGELHVRRYEGVFDGYYKKETATRQPARGDWLSVGCRALLADYKTPREVSFHADFPRDPAGKLVKRLLRDPHWTGRATRV